MRYRFPIDSLHIQHKSRAFYVFGLHGWSPKKMDCNRYDLVAYNTCVRTWRSYILTGLTRINRLKKYEMCDFCAVGGRRTISSKLHALWITTPYRGSVCKIQSTESHNKLLNITINGRANNIQLEIKKFSNRENFACNFSWLLLCSNIIFWIHFTFGVVTSEHDAIFMARQ